MKSFLAAILITSFVAVAVFGIFGMHHAKGQHGGCIAATAQGTPCPEESSPIDFATFHIDAFRSFSLVTLSGDLVSMILFLVVSLIFCASILFLQSFRTPQLAFYRHRFRDRFYPPQQQELTRWLALHENSPASW